MTSDQDELEHSRKLTKFLLLRALPVTFFVLGAAYWLAYRQVYFEYFVHLASLPVFFTAVIVRTAGRLKLWQWSYPLSTAALVWLGFTQLFFCSTPS